MKTNNLKNTGPINGETIKDFYHRPPQGLEKSSPRIEGRTEEGCPIFYLENANFLESRRKKGEALIRRWYKEKGPDEARDVYQEFVTKYFRVDSNGPREWSDAAWYVKLRFFKEDRRKTDNRKKRSGLYGHYYYDAPDAFPIDDSRKPLTRALGMTSTELLRIWSKADSLLDPKAFVTSQVTRRNLPDRLTPLEALNVLTADEKETLVARKNRPCREWQRLVVREFSRSRSRFNDVMSTLLKRASPTD